MSINITLSARQKNSDLPIKTFLEFKFKGVSKDNIESIFGFTDHCKIYGGRHYITAELSTDDLSWMYDNGIGYRIPITSSLATLELYQESKAFLTKHHRPGNSVIVLKDSIATLIKNDFPDYLVECSVIKEIDTVDKLTKSLTVYDTVVPLPIAFNLNYSLLDSLDQAVKDRVRLFLNIGCNYECPARTCYGSFAKMNRGDIDAEFICSQLNEKQHVPNPVIDFDMQKYIDMGFTKFKMLRSRGGTGH